MRRREPSETEARQGAPTTVYLRYIEEARRRMDLGQVTAARAIEPLAMLWCIPGLRQNQWAHAFKLLKL